MTDTKKIPKTVTPRHVGRMRFKQTIDSALSAFLRTRADLNYDAFDPRTTNLRDQSAIVTQFAQFLEETERG